jgi:hypothetical protein
MFCNLDGPVVHSFGHYFDKMVFSRRGGFFAE